MNLKKRWVFRLVLVPIQIMNQISVYKFNQVVIVHLVDVEFIKRKKGQKGIPKKEEEIKVLKEESQQDQEQEQQQEHEE